MNACTIIKNSKTWFTILIIAISVHSVIHSQDTENAPKEKLKVRMSLDFYRINNDQLRLTTSLRTKIGKSYEPVSGVSIDFYKSEVSEENLIGSSKTGTNGEAVINFEEVADSKIWNTYYAVLENNPGYDDADQEVEVLKAIMDFKASEIDSQFIVEVYVGSLDSLGNSIPEEEAEVKLFVKRLFGLLPIGEEIYTDSDGRIEMNFPRDFPGDENGIITVVVQVLDHSDFGTLLHNEELAWGVPTTSEEDEAPDIWLASPTSNASIFLVIATNLVLLIIYGVIVYMIYLLIKINKIGRNSIKENTQKSQLI